MEKQTQGSGSQIGGVNSEGTAAISLLYLDDQTLLLENNFKIHDLKFYNLLLHLIMRNYVIKKIKIRRIFENSLCRRGSLC